MQADGWCASGAAAICALHSASVSQQELAWYGACRQHESFTTLRLAGRSLGCCFLQAPDWPETLTYQTQVSLALNLQ
jgi:hypothetical protein